MSLRTGVALVRIGARPGSPPRDGIADLPLDDAAVAALCSGGRLALPTSSLRGIAIAGLDPRLDGAGLATLLRECRRALGRGGVLRIARRNSSASARGEDSNSSPGARGASPGASNLSRLAGWAGLTSAADRAHGESAIPEFHDLEGADVAGGALEFVKPTRPLRTGPTPVSIVIPAYNPRYFGEALDSALAQTHPDVEVIVSDDDQTGAIEAICEERKRSGRALRLVRNSPRLGGCGNYVRCFELAAGEYVKILNDDDRLAPACMERMADVLDEHGDVTLVTSHRRLIDGAGHDLGEIGSTRRPVGEDAILDGASVAAAVMALRVNFIGEPTTALFRKADMAGSSPTILSFAGREYDWNVDVAMWLSLLSRGDLAYLVASQSDFRLHAEQAQRTPDAEARGVAAWARLREDAAAVGLWRPASPPTVSVIGQSPGAGRARERARHGAGAVEAARLAFAEALLARDPR